MLVLITVIVCQINKLVKLVRTKKKSMNLGMDMEYNTGLMEHTTKDSGTITKLKVKEHSGMLKETYIKVNLRMIWPMVMAIIYILTEVSIKVNLKMMFRKDTEKKNGLMVQSM